MSISPATWRGFTLIELLVTLGVLGILLSIAVPSFQNMVLNNRIAAQANQAITALSYARSEAVKRAVPVVVCSSTSSGTSCSGATNWSSGWMVFADTNANGAVDTGESLRTWPALTGTNTLNSDNGLDRIAFTATGFATGFADTLLLCDQRGPTEGRGVVVNAAGRSYVVKGVASCS